MIHSLGNVNSLSPEPLSSSSSSSSPFIGSCGAHSVLGNLDDNDREDSSMARNSFSKGYMFFEKRKSINMTCSDSDLVADSDLVPPSPSSAPPSKKSPRFSLKKSPSSPSTDLTSTSVVDKRDTAPQQKQQQKHQWKKCEEGCSTNSCYDLDKMIRIPCTNNIHNSTYSDKTNNSDNSLPTTVADVDVATVAAPVTKQQSSLTLSSTSQITTTTTKAAVVEITNTNMNTNTNTYTNNNRTAKVVKFSRRVRIRHVKMLVDMSAEEIESMYYSKEEMVDLRSALRKKINALILQGGVGRGDVDVDVGVDEGFKNTDKDNDGDRLLCHRHYNFEAKCCDCDDDDENCDCGDDDDDDFCVRGIEHEFPQGKFRRRQNKVMSRGIVFEEQRLQRELCGPTYADDDDDDDDVVYKDPVMDIAELYRMESMTALQYALDAAKRDELCAKRIYAADVDADATSSSPSIFEGDDGVDTYILRR